MSLIDIDFWEDPPWGDGKQKYRLGLKPIERDKWLNRKPNETLYSHKKNLLDTSYNKVIATTKYSLNAQKHLADIFEIKDTKYPDLIAELCLNIQDDLCVMESSDEQRLIAASICSPSYWDVRTKIGRPLKEIHDPVVSLDKKIGDKISVTNGKGLEWNGILTKIESQIVSIKKNNAYLRLVIIFEKTFWNEKI